MDIEALMTVLFSQTTTATASEHYTEILELQMWRLSVLVCNKKIAAFSNVLAERVATLRKGLKPLRALTQCMLSWERRALQCRILLSLTNHHHNNNNNNDFSHHHNYYYHLHPHLAMGCEMTIRPRDFERFYGPQMRSTLAEAHNLSPRCTSYTFQYVKRVNLAHMKKTGKKQQSSAVNGEILQRMFISLPSVDAALQFVNMWTEAQKNAESQEATCMLECGTHDNTLRKWVLDVDASVASLISDGHILSYSEEERERMNTATLRMASVISHALHKMGLLHRPCSFAVISRHSESKMSWHITLHALASHDVWRNSVCKLDAHYKANKGAQEEWLMYKYVDETTKRNSKGQYMQILGSTKVKPGCAQEGHFFRMDGLFDCDGRPLSSSSPTPLSSRGFIMAYAATSIVIHDPWSLPFTKGSSSIVSDDSKKRKNASASSNSKPTTATTKKPKGSNNDDSDGMMIKASWAELPEEPRKWMVDFVQGTPKYIPSMSKPSNWCGEVTKLIQTGRAKLLVYAYIDEPAVCPRFLKIKGAQYKHQNNEKCVVMCVEEAHPTCSRKSYRMFMRCFSSKCKALISPRYAQGWIEVRTDYYYISTNHNTNKQNKTTTVGYFESLHNELKQLKKSQVAKYAFTNSSRGLAPAIQNEIGRHANSVPGVYVHISKGLSEKPNVVWPFSTWQVTHDDYRQLQTLKK